MFQTVSQNSQTQSLDPSDGFFPILAVGQNSGQIGNFSQPTIILFAFSFNAQAHKL